jgi:hypothetical protein
MPQRNQTLDLSLTDDEATTPVIKVPRANRATLFIPSGTSIATLDLWVCDTESGTYTLYYPSYIVVTAAGAYPLDSQRDIFRFAYIKVVTGDGEDDDVTIQFAI